MGEIHEIEEKIENNYSENITLKHGTENTLNEIKKITKEIHEKEFGVEDLKNQIAKLKYNEKNIKEILKKLNNEFKETQNTLKYNSDIIEEYEKEFKKGIDELAKKTNVLDRLNNKLETLIRNNQSQSGDTGDNNIISSPLEHTIHHLNKELKCCKSKCDELQKMIIKQTELVNLINDTMKKRKIWII